MAIDRYSYLPRLHSSVQHSGDLNAFITESGTYSPLSYWESYHWQREVYKKEIQFGFVQIALSPLTLSYLSGISGNGGSISNSQAILIDTYLSKPLADNNFIGNEVLYLNPINGNNIAAACVPLIDIYKVGPGTLFQMGYDPSKGFLGNGTSGYFNTRADAVTLQCGSGNINMSYIISSINVGPRDGGFNAGVYDGGNSKFMYSTPQGGAPSVNIQAYNANIEESEETGTQVPIGVHIVTTTASGTIICYKNGSQIASGNYTTPGVLSSNSYFIGDVNVFEGGSGSPANDDISLFSLGSSLTPSRAVLLDSIYRAYNIATQRILATFTPIYCLGDSICAGSNGFPGWVGVLDADLAAESGQPRCLKMGIAGSTAKLLGNTPDATTMFNNYVVPTLVPANNIFFSLTPFNAWMIGAWGTNDLGTYNDTDTYNAIVAIATLARSYNLRFCASTILPRADFTTQQEIYRVSINTMLLANVGSVFDAIADVASIPNMNTQADASNTTYFSDGTHPTTLGHSLMAPVYKAAINLT